MSDSVPKYLYDEERKKVELLNRENAELRVKLANVQEKYNALKYPEVVRSQIETYERLWGDSFVEDEKRTENLHGFAKSREIRRQKWYHILMLSPCTDVTFLRTLILFNGLDEEKYFSNFKGNNYKSVKNKTGYHKYVELNTLKEKHLQQIKNDVFVEALLQYLKNPKVPPTNVMFNSWYKQMFTDFATNIAEVYSHISDKIHNATFDSSDQLPAEYAILKQPILDQCINYIMSFYSDCSKPESTERVDTIRD